MINFSEFSILSVLAVIIGAFSLLLNCWIFRFFSKKLKNEKNKNIQLEELLSALTLGNTGVGNRLIELEKRMQSLQHSFETKPKRGNSASYEQVEQLVELGAGIDDLVYSCGYSPAEAELAMILHKRSSNKST